MRYEEFEMRELAMGIYDGPHATPPRSEKGGVFLGIKNITEDGKLDLSSPFYIALEDLKKWTRRVTPKPGDIVFSYEATLHRYAIIPDKFFGCLGRRLALIRPNTKLVDTKYLFYIFLSPFWRSFIEANIINGSTVDRIPLVKFPKYKIALPPLPIQHRIADILSAYDELIEINQQRIRLLEDTARQLYREWFVRLRFPGWKEAKMVKGVPEGWEVKELMSFGRIYTGKTPSTSIKEYYGGDIPFIKTPDMHNNIFVFDTQETLTEKGNSTQLRSSLPENSICVSCIGTGGVVAITTAKKSQTNQQINSLILQNPVDLEFLYFRICDLKETIELFGYTGATMTNLSKGKFERLKILYPKAKFVEEYHLIANPIFEQIKILQQQNTHLRQIRDRLLPRLVSGKMAVKEVEPVTGP